jgi:phosphopantothenoylcysteine decarboxylase/phosphopantothenate--cysteine ligase
MRVLITLGGTREPIDAVRFIGNRSSGQLGAALVEAAVSGGHPTTVIAAAVSVPINASARRIDVQTAAEMMRAVLLEFPAHDLLIMAAAVSDYRPRTPASGKLERGGALTIEFDPTEDILAAVARIKRPDQRTVGFSLESWPNPELGPQRAARKLIAKSLDLIVANPLNTVNSPCIDPTLIYPDGHPEPLQTMDKTLFGNELLSRCLRLFA